MGGGAGVGTDAGGTGAGFGLAGPSRCASAGVPFCESFENGLDSATWTTTKNGDTTIAVDDMRSARGSKALHIKTTAGDFAYITEKKSFPATNNVLYGRMYVWFEDALTTDGHFSLAEGAGTGTPAVVRFGGQFKQFGVGTDAGSSGDWTDKDTSPSPPRPGSAPSSSSKGTPTSSAFGGRSRARRAADGPHKARDVHHAQVRQTLVWLVDVQHERATRALDRRDRRRLPAHRLRQVGKTQHCKLSPHHPSQHSSPTTSPLRSKPSFPSDRPPIHHV